MLIYTHKKQSGGSGQFGRREGHVTPGERGQGVGLSKTRSRAGISRANISPAIEKGFREQAASGHLVGFPIIDFSIKLTRWGVPYDVEFERGSRSKSPPAVPCVKSRKSRGIKLLEPDHEGRSRHARGLPWRCDRRPQQPARTDPGHRHATAMPQRWRLSCRSPNMFGYVNELRSFTQGRASIHHACGSSRITNEVRPMSQPRSRRNLPKLRQQSRGGA